MDYAFPGARHRLNRQTLRGWGTDANAGHLSTRARLSASSARPAAAGGPCPLAIGEPMTCARFRTTFSPQSGAPARRDRLPGSWLRYDSGPYKNGNAIRDGHAFPWLAVVIDHYSRRLMGFAVFPKRPDSVSVRSFLGRTIARANATPKYFVCDKDKIFWCEGFKRWCRRKRIRPRYGAAGQHGSIALTRPSRAKHPTGSTSD